MPILDQLRAALSDRYTIERELGGGGMSLVFVATELALDRRVVIKVLAPELGQSVNVERFKREIATLATLQHPQIVPVFSAGQAGELLYYVMPFVAGESLGARLVRDGVLGASEVLRLLTPIARALAFAHREGVVHRDIKPDNILLAQGEPVLADFGIAKVLRDGSTHGTLTSAGMSIGTVTYMAPEQVLAEPTIDGRADVYSLAAVGFELLTGRAPFVGTQQQVMSAHVVQPPPLVAAVAPDTPAALSDVIARGLAKEPVARPTAAEFVALLESASRSPAIAPAVGRSPDVSPPLVAHASQRGRTLGLAALLLATIGGGWWWMAGRGSTANRGAAVAAASLARAGIAVLPFERIGGSEDEYLAAGLTDELMSQLAEVQDLRVASRTTVRVYADSALPPAELGKRLDARALIEGSVQRAGEQLRVSTRLVDVRDGNTLWSERYERPMRDLFAVQREIGAAVVKALTPRLGLTGQTGRTQAGTNDAAAYDLFLRARFALDQRGVDSLRSAITLFTQATERDSMFARAFAGIAEATALLPQYGGGGYADIASAIRSSAERALSLDSTLAAPHMALGLLSKGIGSWAAAEQEFALALKRQPDFAAAHQNLSELFYTLGRVDYATRSMARAASLEPTNVAIASEFAFTLALTGQLDSAQRVIDRTLARDDRNPFAHFTRAVIRERQGDINSAVAAMSLAVERAPLPLMIGSLSRLAHIAADTAVERAARRQLDARGNASGTALGRLIADLETADATMLIPLLDRAIAERDPFVYQLPLRLWWFDRLREAPGFASAAQRMGLPMTAIQRIAPAVVPVR
jgi:eukaryotic-like serine/threonine-protein kinase